MCWRVGLAWLLARALNPFLLCVVALAVASVAWSIDPALSLRRLVRLGTIVLVCVAFVLMGWHARRYQNVVRPILTLVLLGSIVFGLVFPALGDPSGGCGGTVRCVARARQPQERLRRAGVHQP